MAEGKNLVGVDIGASSIKVVQLKESRKKLQVDPLGMRAAASADDRRRPRDELRGRDGGARARSFTTARSSSATCAIGVYGQSVIVRKITVPMMTPTELDEQIHWEAEQHIPFDIKLMSIDYEVLRRRPEAGQMDLLLVAAKKDEINDYAAILREAKLQAAGRRHQRLHRPEHLRAPVRARREDRPSRSSTSARRSPRSTSCPRASARSRARSRTPATPSPRRSSKAARVLVRAGRGATSTAAGATQIVPQAGDRRSSTRRAWALAGEIQRSLDFYLATSGEQEIGTHLRLRRERVPRAARRRRSRSARASRSRSSIPWSNLSVDPKFVNEQQLRARRRSWSSRSASRLRCDKERRQWSA